MGDFFKDWRRKIGVVTLGLACMFAAGWVRSESLEDRIYLPLGQFGIQFDSLLGRVVCIVGSSVDDLKWVPDGVNNPYRFECRTDDVDPDVHLPTFVFRRFDFLTTSTLELMVPYWAIVIPFTLLSAYLLLRSPRPKQEPKPDA